MLVPYHNSYTESEMIIDTISSFIVKKKKIRMNVRMWVRSVSYITLLLSVKPFVRNVNILIGVVYKVYNTVF